MVVILSDNYYATNKAYGCICCYSGIVSPEEFSLSDLNSQIVSYATSQQEIGAEALYDTFNLTVSSGQLLINNKVTSTIIIQVMILDCNSLRALELAINNINGVS